MKENDYEDNIDNNIDIDKSKNESNNNNNDNDNNDKNKIEDTHKNESNTNNEKQNIQKKEIKDINKNSKKEEKKDYKKIAKEYISQCMNDTKYIDKIKTNPLSIFDSIDEEKLDKWETLLSNICPLTIQIKNNKDKEIMEYPYSSNVSQRTVISNDSKRTRVRESILYPNYIETLQKILTYYCEKSNCIYKQGLNEIFGPLLLMKYKLKNISLTNIINLGAMIVDTFLPNYFYEKEIYSLKSALGLFLILLKYHEPTVFNKLDTMEVKPEIYATNWMVTYISGKISLTIFYYLWDKIINIEDPLFIQFLLLALIIDKRELILNCDLTLLPTVMTSLTIRSLEELNKIIKKANKLREQTPYSFRLLADKIGFLKRKNNDIKANYEKYHPELLPAMPIFPSEVLYITYKSQIYCIDPNCTNYATDFKLKSRILARRTIAQRAQTLNILPNKNSKPISNIEKNYNCEKCDLGIEKNMQYILLDLRILEYGEDDDETDKTGFLPSMISVSQDELKSEDFSNIMTNRFNTVKGNYHFIFLTSSTDTFTDFESNYYIENITEEDKKKMMFGVIEQKKIDKELNIDNAKKNLSLKQIYKLKEYDNMRNTLKSMTEHNFPYVGYVYGGFNNVHKEAPKFQVELVGHNEEICLLCKKENKKKTKKDEDIEEDNDEKNELYKALWEHKQKIKYKNLDIFFKNPKNRIYLCVLKEYNKKDIEYGKVQILINELLDKFEIEIYKFDKFKQYNDFENTVLIRNVKEKQKYYDYGKDQENNDEDLELTLLEKVHVLDILKMIQDPKSKNLVTCEIRGEKKKEKFLGLFKKKENVYEIVTIIFDFSSSSEARNFMGSFRDFMKNYRESLKKK